MGLKEAFALLAGAWMLVWWIFTHFPGTRRGRLRRNFRMPAPETDTKSAPITSAIYKCESPETRIVRACLEDLASQGLDDIEARLRISAASCIVCVLREVYARCIQTLRPRFSSGTYTIASDHEPKLRLDIGSAKVAARMERRTTSWTDGIEGFSSLVELAAS